MCVKYDENMEMSNRRLSDKGRNCKCVSARALLYKHDDAGFNYES